MKHTGFNISLLAFFVFFVDRVTKWYAITDWAYGYYVNKFLSFELVLNRGISWGLFHSDSATTFSIVTSVIIAITALVVGYTWIKWHNHESIVAETLVIAGSCSNIFDRITYGGVIDFLAFSWGEWSFPVFNIADCAIVTGSLFMFLYATRK